MPNDTTSTLSNTIDVAELTYEYPIDYVGDLESNHIINDIYEINALKTPYIVMRCGSYFKTSMKIINMKTGNIMTPDVDYVVDYMDSDASMEVGKPCYTCVKFLKPDTTPQKVSLEYRVVGGRYINRLYVIALLLRNIDLDSRQTYWKDVVDKPISFPPMDHTHPLSQITNMTPLVKAIIGCAEVSFNTVQAMEARLLSIIQRMDADNTDDHNIIQAMIDSLDDYARNGLKELNTSLNNLTTLVNTELPKKVDKTQTVNGKALTGNIKLEAPDVDAVSATYGGTFNAGFIDNTTNYGRFTDSSRVINIVKSQIDNLPAGAMIPVSKSVSANILPADVGFSGVLYKYPNPSTTRDTGYQVMLIGNDGELYTGFATGTTMIWKDVASGGGVPIGGISMYTGLVVPDERHFMLAGGSYKAASYPDLYKVLNTNQLADFRGYVPRGLDSGRGVDSEPWRAMLSTQQDAMFRLYGTAALARQGGRYSPSIGFSGVFSEIGRFSAEIKSGGGDDWGSIIAFDNANQGPTASETRMKNIAVNFIIRAK